MTCIASSNVCCTVSGRILRIRIYSSSSYIYIFSLLVFVLLSPKRLQKMSKIIFCSKVAKFTRKMLVDLTMIFQFMSFFFMILHILPCERASILINVLKFILIKSRSEMNPNEQRWLLMQVKCNMLMQPETECTSFQECKCHLEYPGVSICNYDLLMRCTQRRLNPIYSFK